MIRTPLLASLGSIALVIGLAVPNATAQTRSALPATQPSRSVAPTQRGVAVIDVNRVFKNYSLFTSAMADLKRDLEAEDAQTQRQLDAIKAQVEQSKSLSPGTPQYKQLEASIVQARSDLQVRVELRRKDFAEAESGIYYAAYQRVNLAIQYYAQSTGYSLVLRFSGEEPRQDQPNQVLQHINKAVVWVDKRNDITDGVINYLVQLGNQGTQPAAGASMTQSNTGVRPQRQ